MIILCAILAAYKIEVHGQKWYKSARLTETMDSTNLQDEKNNRKIISRKSLGAELECGTELNEEHGQQKLA